MAVDPPPHTQRPLPLDDVALHRRQRGRQVETDRVSVADHAVGGHHAQRHRDHEHDPRKVERDHAGVCWEEPSLACPERRRDRCIRCIPSRTRLRYRIGSGPAKQHHPSAGRYQHLCTYSRQAVAAARVFLSTLRMHASTPHQLQPGARWLLPVGSHPQTNPDADSRALGSEALYTRIPVRRGARTASRTGCPVCTARRVSIGSSWSPWSSWMLRSTPKVRQPPVPSIYVLTYTRVHHRASSSAPAVLSGLRNETRLHLRRQ